MTWLQLYFTNPLTDNFFVWNFSKDLGDFWIVRTCFDCSVYWTLSSPLTQTSPNWGLKLDFLIVLWGPYSSLKDKQKVICWPWNDTMFPFSFLSPKHKDEMKFFLSSKYHLTPHLIIVVVHRFLIQCEVAFYPTSFCFKNQSFSIIGFQKSNVQ